MRVAYTEANAGERYLMERNAARSLVRALDPELELLAFQTRHGAKMTKGIPYCALFSSFRLTLLSVPIALSSEPMRATFERQVLPYVLKRIQSFRRDRYHWPCVVVLLEGCLHEVTCARGAEFPNPAEIAVSVNDPGRRLPALESD